jgi:PAP2 superfamily
MGSGWFDVLGAGWFDPQWGDPEGGGVTTFAMRTDTPMVAQDTPPVTNPVFPVHGWDADLYAMTLLPDFLSATTPAGVSWEKYIIQQIGDPPPIVLSGPITAPGQDSIDDLRILAVTQRPEALGEILNQNKKLQLCFLQLMMMTKTSHPRTYLVVKVASRVGEVVMMRLKRYFNRARPSQYFPTLYPPLPVQEHASYPSGHSIIAHLVAGCLIEITTPDGGVSPYEPALLKLADDIGLNRIYAGLHFRSDIDAGATAGRLAHEFLKDLPDRPPQSPADFTYASLIRDAKKEWP